jgi:hypothetical protein
MHRCIASTSTPGTNGNPYALHLTEREYKPESELFYRDGRCTCKFSNPLEVPTASGLLQSLGGKEIFLIFY